MTDVNGARRVLFVCGAAVVLLACAMTWLSEQFAFESNFVDRPLWMFLGLMTGIFVVHLLALRTAFRLPETNSLVAIIWLVAVLARLAVLPSHPIQEVDLYRYLWDGQVTLSGVSPFRFAPETVILATQSYPADEELVALAQHVGQHAAIGTILSRVHYPELPTVYPPVSQVVFAVVAAVVPDDASLRSHVIAMKFVMVLFDLASLGLLLRVLRITQLSRAWAIAYAWNPLVLKEFAGSGHLDSIAVCFTLAAIVASVEAMSHRESCGCQLRWLLAAAMLGLAFGAKLYPLILFPLFLESCRRSAGLKNASKFAIVFVGVAALTVSPVLTTTRYVPPTIDIELAADVEFGDSEASGQPTRATDGIETFLTRWEINDPIFVVIIENIRPATETGPQPWFAVIPDKLRSRISTTAARWLQTDIGAAAFIIARVITLIVFAIAIVWLLKRMPARDPSAFCRVAFLTLALFWLLSPTLNPWYWIWALPLIGYAHSRGWLLVSGLVAIYYLRFWFAYHADDPLLTQLPYYGVATFHYIVVFIEHAPWMGIIVLEALRRRSGTKNGPHARN